MTLRETLIDARIDFVNNWLSVEAWASHNHLSGETAREILHLAQQLHNADLYAFDDGYKGPKIEPEHIDPQR